MIESTEFRIEPAISMRDRRIIRSLADAIAFVRDHEARPGVDDRDEVLHGLERARTVAERRAAAEAFLVWARELDLVAPAEPPGPRSGRRPRPTPPVSGLGGRNQR
jgi:hypothetical protein